MQLKGWEMLHRTEPGKRVPQGRQPREGSMYVVEGQVRMEQVPFCRNSGEEQVVHSVWPGPVQVRHTELHEKQKPSELLK